MLEPEEILVQLNAAKSGRVSLAEALHKLTLVETAFLKIQGIDAQLKRQSELIQELKNERKSLVTFKNTYIGMLGAKDRPGEAPPPGS